MYACYRREDAAEAGTMLDAVAAVLAEYPVEVMQRVTDPRTGLPGRIKFPPSVYEVKEACEIAMAPILARQQRERREVEARNMVEERERADADRTQRPSYDDLRAKYGPNFGLKAKIEESDDKHKQMVANLRRANQVAFDRECEAAGIDPSTANVSPALAALILGPAAQSPKEEVA